MFLFKNYYFFENYDKIIQQLNSNSQSIKKKLISRNKTKI